jgi:hypothetical protein
MSHLPFQEFLQIFVLGPVTIPLGIIMSSLIVHFFLWLLNGANRSLTSTIKVNCYASAIDLLQIIPLLGMLVGGIWCFVVKIIGLKTVHDTSYGKVIAAKLIPALLCCCCCMFFGLIMIWIGSTVMHGDTNFYKHLFDLFKNYHK